MRSWGYGQAGPFAEFDPGGVNPGFADPTNIPPGYIEPDIPSFFWTGQGQIPQYKCQADGSPAECHTVTKMIRDGLAAIVPGDDLLPIQRGGQPTWARYSFTGDGYKGYAPIGEKYRGQGVLEFSGRRRVAGDTDLYRLNNVYAKDDGELAKQPLYISSTTVASSMPVEPLGYGRVVHQERNYVRTFCAVTAVDLRTGKATPGPIEEKGIATDITTAIIVYSPELTAKGLNWTLAKFSYFSVTQYTLLSNFG